MGLERRNCGHPAQDDFGAALAWADQAMYRVKRSGAGFYIAQPSGQPLLDQEQVNERGPLHGRGPPSGLSALNGAASATQAPTQAAIRQPAVVRRTRKMVSLGVTGHGDRMEACLLRPSPVHPPRAGVGQVLGDEVGDHQHVGLGKGGLFELGQGLLRAGHQIGPSVKTSWRESAPPSQARCRR